MTIWDEKPNLVDELKALYAQGLSFGVIARKLGNGISRSAAIGKATRLKLPCAHRGVTVRVARPSLPKPPPKPKHPPRAEALDPPPLTMADGCAITILNAPKAKICRYPFGEGVEMRFCGRDIVRGNYCAHHAVLCLQEPQPHRKSL